MRASLKLADTLRVTRRSSLAALTGGVAWFLGASRPASAQAAQKASLLARSVERVPDDPQDARWQQSDVLLVPLAPQAVVKPRLLEAGVKAITARALYDAERIALNLTWRDTSSDALMGSMGMFRDAVAVQFPAEPAAGIPYFAMGEPDKPVTIYQWKADWQFAREGEEDERFPHMAVDWYPYTSRAPGEIAEASDYAGKGGEKAFMTSWYAGNSLGDLELQKRTSVEKLEAEGFGTLTTVPADRQDGFGKAVRKEGAWSLVVTIPRAQDRFVFEPGMTVPVAFAAWEGARRERGGEKAVSTWYFLSLEKRIGKIAFWSPVLVLLAALAAQAWWLKRLRRRAQQVEGS